MHAAGLVGKKVSRDLKGPWSGPAAENVPLNCEVSPAFAGALPNRQPETNRVGCGDLFESAKGEKLEREVEMVQFTVQLSRST